MRADSLSEITLSQLAANVGLSHTWIKKIEKRIKLPLWGSGIRGKKSYYTFEQQELFRKIALLRRLDIEFDMIKDLYDIEKEIARFLRKHFPVDDKTRKERYANVYLIQSVEGGSMGIEYDADKREASKKLDGELVKMYEIYANTMKIVSKRADSQISELKTAKDEFLGITGEK
ncbi:MAG: hypothetical protein PHG63_03750 [Candidatus Dojkabacteria bacterium]|nr:hypothetical protein [Candidatus Dojkabacteria bacterium]